MVQMISPSRTVYTYADALRWSTQIAEGLLFMHSAQPMVLHRDMKTENILLVSGPGGALSAMIGDFGEWLGGGGRGGIQGEIHANATGGRQPTEHPAQAFTNWCGRAK